MRKIIEKEVEFCDACGKEAYCQKCLGCSKEYCYDCREKLMVEYRHSLHFGGSYDGHFCQECDTNPPEHIKRLHHAYQTMRSLKNEWEGSYANIERRAKSTEARIKALSKF